MTSQLSAFPNRKQILSILGFLSTAAVGSTNELQAQELSVKLSPHGDEHFLLENNIPNGCLFLLQESSDLKTWSIVTSELDNKTSSVYLEIPTENTHFYRTTSTTPQIPLFQIAEYNVSSNTTDIKHLGPTQSGIYEISASTDKQSVILTRSSRNLEIDIFKILPSSKEPINITNDPWIEFSIVTTDDQDIAYLQSQYSSETISIILNGEPLSSEKLDNKVIYDNLSTNNEYLVFCERRPWDNRYFLYAHSLESNSTIKVDTEKKYVQKPVPTNNGAFLIQLFDFETHDHDIYSFKPKTGSLALLHTSPNYERINQTSADKTIIETATGDNNSLILYHAIRLWSEHQTSNPFSSTDNSLGRLSWNQSYILEALILLFEKTQNPVFFGTLNNAIASILDIRNENNPKFVSIEPTPLWSTTKYSLDKTSPLNLLVSDAKILYPLLKAYNSNLLTEELRPLVLDTAIEAYSYFEKDYDPSISQYKFTKGINFVYDGLWLPNNMQNAWGLVLIELFKATGNSIYKERVQSLAKRFRGEWDDEADNRALWSYWPTAYYQGWNLEDNLSQNSPGSPPQVDTLKEDTSHAGISVKFVQEYRAHIEKVTFSDSDLIHIRNTLDRIITNQTFTRFTSGDTIYSQPDYQYIPKYGWATLENQSLNDHYASGIAVLWPNFDAMDILTAYAESYDPELPTKIELTLSTYDVNNQLQAPNTKVLSSATDILTHFGVTFHN